MQRSLLADAVSIQGEVQAETAQELLRGPSTAVAAVAPPRVTQKQDNYSIIQYLHQESVWVRSQRSPVGFCSAGSRSAAGRGGHRGVPWERAAEPPCPGPWEAPPCFQANINSSCSFPEEVFNPHCTQYITGYNFLKRERVFLYFL